MKMRTRNLMMLAALLLTTITATAQNQYEWTSKIQNASFENWDAYWSLDKNVSGWEDIAVKDGESYDGERRYNIWAQKVTSLDLHQTISLPAGKYTLTTQVKTNTQGFSDQHLYVVAGTKSYSSSNLSQGNDEYEKLTVDFTLTGETLVTLGVASTGDSETEKGWFNVDDFRLWSDSPDEPDMNETVERVTSDVQLTGRSDYHITSKIPFSQDGYINIVNTEHAVIFFDNLRPTEVKNYLIHVKINGAKAVSESNCQLRLYNQGTLLYPYGKENKKETGFHPLTVYSERNFQGESCDRFGIENTKGFMNSLTDETLNNRIRSFRLKRGYMVTFALQAEGYGYQRCFIADDADLMISSLPEIMDKRISSYRIFRWDNIGKNGVAAMMDTDDLKKLNATWTYDWGPGRDLGPDYECVPHMNNLWSTTTYELGVNNQSPYLKTDNEPANGNDPYPASIDDELKRWPELMRTGRRLVSPSSFDSGEWFHDAFFNAIDERGWRCDVVDIHCYWDIGKFWTIWGNWANKYHRPVWITEFIWGASWSGGFGVFGIATTDEERGNPSDWVLWQNREKLESIWWNLNQWDYVERYAYWNYEWPCSKILWNGELTPAGEVFATMESKPGYNSYYDYVPTDWKCNAASGLLATYNPSKKICSVEWQSNTGGLAETTTLMRKKGDGDWEEVKKWEKADDVFFTYEDPISENGKYTYRVVEETWKGETLKSDKVNMSTYIVNATINTESKSEIKGWTCERNAQNGYTKGDWGNTYFEVWDEKAENIDFNYYQDIDEIENGVYQLTAAAFNYTDGVSGAAVNGRVGIYAMADGVCYFEPVTIDEEINWDHRLSIDKIVVRNGKMRIGVRNFGEMSARWAGADDFELTYLGTEEEVLTESYEDVVKNAEQKILNTFDDLGEGKMNATGLIANPRCSRGTNDFWTCDNLSINKGESSDGSSSNKYWDKWSSEELYSSMSQTINYLPSGTYMLGALLRGTTDVDLELYGTRVGADGTKKTFSKSVKGADNTTVSGSDYKNGWIKVETEPFEIGTGDILKVGGNVGARITAWWSLDDFQLTYIDPFYATGITEHPSIARPAEKAVFDLQGRRVMNPQRGLYIVNGKKVLYK